MAWFAVAKLARGPGDIVVFGSEARFLVAAETTTLPFAIAEDLGVLSKGAARPETTLFVKRHF